ncbi:MAG: hypothetical protein JO267_04810 [Alphaproteobacteria bacterium]|nr:hypothetical protein [Alphaproteobacteria bacterium]MBV9861451.1 hypothetical protein [Alphaproteobacteria bacterium]
MRHVLGLALAATLLAGGATAALADSSTASLGGDTGGVGINPTGTGFDGTLGDPDYYAGTGSYQGRGGGPPPASVAPGYRPPETPGDNGTGYGYYGYQPVNPGLQYNYGPGTTAPGR